nr:hypothetical protein [Tanacetum cinerariifolium]
MSTSKFAEVHNLVAFLSKPTESEGFEQIVDFLNANLIKYALTVNPAVYTSCIEQLWATAKAKTINGEAQIHAKTKVTEVPQPSDPTEKVVDEAVNKEMDNSLERAATTATSLDAEQDRGNINKTQSKATPNEPSFIGTSSGGGLRRQDTIEDTVAQTRSENVSKFSNDPLLAGFNTPRSGKDSMKLNELMEICTTLQNRVLALETTKTTQALEIESLKRRVKKLERRKKSSTYGLKKLYKVGHSARVESLDDNKGLSEEDASKQRIKISDIDADEGTTLVNDQDDIIMFDANKDLQGEEVIVEQEVVAELIVDSAKVSAVATVTIDDITLAKALEALKTSKPKIRGIVIRDHEEQRGYKKSQAKIAQEESSKRVGDELEQERSKKQKVEDDKESEELKQCLEIILDNGDDCSITEFVYLIEAHHHLNPIFVPKYKSPMRLDDGVVMLVLEARGHPLRFGEVHLSLVALNPKLEVFYALAYNQLSGPLVDGRSENLLVFRWEVVQVALKV